MAENWPDWWISPESASELARYVDTSYTRSWVPADIRGPWHSPGEGRDRAQRLYNELRDHWIGYAHEPWNPSRHREGRELRYQRIRGPEETIQGPATCLDLALLYAGMALCAGVRPLISLRTGREPHALVLLDVRGQLSDMTPSAEQNAPPSAVERAADPGVWDLPGEDVFARLGAADGWLLVDVAWAARRGGSAGALFGEASGRRVAEMLAGATPGDHQWALVDIDAVLARGDRKAYTPPTGVAVPPIHGYLPAIPAFYEYRTRQKLLAELLELVDPAGRSEPAIVVLQGNQGFGKSMLAHRLAVAADHGCGWFLNATDVKSLTASLARAERQEKELRGEQAAGGASGEKPDPGEDRALASAALDRLRDAERPWVVVLDNCDAAPETAGLQELIPAAHRAGQTVIITTTDRRWESHAKSRGWLFRQLSALDAEDLGGLGLPPGLSDAVGGRPLIAQALAALQDNGADLPAQTDLDGPELVWDLLRSLPDADPDSTAIARILAWCPPEPMNAAALITVAGDDGKPHPPHATQAGHTLEQLHFAIPSFPQSGTALLMHRLFAAAVREQTWRDHPSMAGDVINRLLTSEPGQAFFIGASDETALARLEHGAARDDPGEVAQAADHLADQSRCGLLWHGLGRVRERRGPVRQSAPHFRAAVALLSRVSYPAEVAESMIGQARVIYQTGPAANEQLVDARDVAGEARRLLEPLTGREPRQLSEQGNALVWLITQRLADREADPAQRAVALAEVRSNLWLSYEERRRIHRPDHAFAPGSDPGPDDGLGSERAFFNLAGVNIQLAKTHHKLAEASSSPTAERDALRAEAAADLDQAARIYEVVRALREQRYAGRAHPHLASCIHGQALVAYFRAALLGQPGQLGAAFGFASVALDQRRKVAGGLIGPEAPEVLHDNDVGKSVEFTLKLCTAAIAERSGEPAAAAAVMHRVLDEVADEYDGPIPDIGVGEA